ncbi:MAG TPA: endonuclease/exonuclease/phosphatase family protein [Gemmatimonadales bacterium]
MRLTVTGGARATAVRAVWLALLAGCAGAAPPSPGAPAEVPIPAIQGRSHYSPVAGRAVRSSGVVTAVADGAVYVQDPRGDGDPATSDALVLVLAGAPDVREGDRIRFRGTVTETAPGGPRTANLSGTTVVGEVLDRLGAGEPLPEPVVLGPGGRWPPPPAIISADELPVRLDDSNQARANAFDPEEDAIDWFESLEAMRVRVPAPVAVSPLRTYGRRSSEVFTLPDGGTGVDASRRTRPGGILLQSGPANRGSQNTERVQIQLDAALHPWPPPPIAVGDRLGDVVGVLRYDFGSYEVAVTAPFQVRPGGAAPEVTRLRGSERALTIASYNIHNLSAQPGDSARRALLGRQIARDLGAPAIVALQEIQDDSGERDDGTTEATGTLRALVSAVEQAGGPRYQFVDVAPADGRPGGAPGGNIRNALLYDVGRVSLDSHRSLAPDLLAAAGARDTAAFLQSRDPLVGVFTVRGRRLTVINNHLTSRYGSTPAFGAVQPFVQEGDAERAAQAAALRAYVARLLDEDPDAAIVVLGDMNTFEFTDALSRVLPGEPPLLFPLAPLVPPAERYTYNFEGNSQALDHVFVTRALRAGAELDAVHLNVDFPARGGVTVSDHEPLVARLVLPGAAAP